MQAAKEHILVIKHGALGDIVLATGPFKAIRDKHKDAHITLLTTAPYVRLLEPSGYFNEIWVDHRPRPWQLWHWVKLALLFKSRAFTWVYDLQTSGRSSRYFWLFYPRPFWSGIVKNASHRHDTAHRTKLHTIDRQKEQLAIAGIENVPAPDIAWLKSDASRFCFTGEIALLVPGGSAHRSEKRWNPEGYIKVAHWLVKRGIIPVLIGTNAESTLLKQIADNCSQAINLCNQTNFADIASLARCSTVAVGNDTGPMHIIAASGCHSLVLFSAASNPALCAPRGGRVSVIEQPDLNNLAADVVIAALRQKMPA